MTDRRQFLAGGVLIAASGAARWLAPRAHYAALSQPVLAEAVPEQIGAYRYLSADDIVMPPRDPDSVRTYEQYLARNYFAPGQAPITLLIAYGSVQDYSLQMHRPESCYPASGFVLGDHRLIELPLKGRSTIPADALTAQRVGGHYQQLLYWTRLGSDFPTTLWAQRAIMMRDALAGRTADGVLVRFSTPVIGRDAIAALAGFYNALLADIGPAARRLLLGPYA